MIPELGQTFTYARTFSREDVELFARLTGDAGRHHVEPDAQGRVMVHGLLTATLPTHLGGEIHYIAREMHFTFVRPVFTGDTITTEVRWTEVVDEDKQWRLAAEGVCRNQHGKDVLEIRSNGIILK